jgi:cytochrome c oxidase subunit 4
MSQHATEHHVVPYRVYVIVWAALLILTGVTVAVSQIDMKHVAVLAAMMIAAFKGTLVILYFMHVRFEKPMYACMILAAFGTYAVFITLTFTDYSFR